jgi:poly(ADP-ribose) glycohydrolase ARH3
MVRAMVSENFRSRCVGSLLGTAFGDTLGAAVEMRSRAEIRLAFGEVRDFLPHARGFGRYTDDTEMTLALARSLIDRRGIDAADCSRRYGEAFTPRRGYGRSAVSILDALNAGADYRQTGTRFFAEGSFGNGAAMRIAPLGLLYGGADESVFRAAVFDAVRCTHVHPEAVETAYLQALAVGSMFDLPSGAEPDAQVFIARLNSFCRYRPLQRRLTALAQLLATDADGDAVAECFACGVRSADSWPPALWAALRFCDDPEEAIVQAVNLGGDCDTIGAMTGALVGALHGDRRFPRRWFAQLENGPHGRDEIIRTGELLAELCRQFRADQAPAGAED